MLYDIRYRKKKISVYASFRENYEDVIFLHDIEEMDYEFFIKEFSRLLIGKSEVHTVDATRIYHTIDRAQVIYYIL